MLESEGIASLYMNSYVPITKDPSPEWSKTSGPSISKFLFISWKFFCEIFRYTYLVCSLSIGHQFNADSTHTDCLRSACKLFLPSVLQ